MESQVIQVVNEARAITLQIRAAALPDIAGPGLPNDADEALNRPDLEARVSDFIETHAVRDLLQRIVDYTSFIDIPFFSPENVRVPQQVRYASDGDTVTYTYNTATKKWEMVKGSSRDARGNKIPETRQDVDGGGVRTYFFGDIGNQNNFDAFNDLLNRVSLMDVPVVNAANNDRAGALYYMTCAADVCTIWVKY